MFVWTSDSRSIGIDMALPLLCWFNSLHSSKKTFQKNLESICGNLPFSEIICEISYWYWTGRPCSQGYLSSQRAWRQGCVRANSISPSHQTPQTISVWSWFGEMDTAMLEQKITFPNLLSPTEMAPFYCYGPFLKFTVTRLKLVLFYKVETHQTFLWIFLYTISQNKICKFC